MEGHPIVISLHSIQEWRDKETNFDLFAEKFSCAELPVTLNLSACQPVKQGKRVLRQNILSFSDEIASGASASVAFPFESTENKSLLSLNVI